MKKVMAITLFVLLLFVLCSCGDANNQQIPNNSIDGIKTTNSISNQTTTSDTPSTNSTPLTNQSSASTDTTQCIHSWGQWIEKTEATCQVYGIKERMCHNCQITESEKVNMTDHKESDWIVGQEAKVGEDGVKYIKCIYCNKRLKEKALPAISEKHQHTVDEWITIKTATCTANGIQNAICSCGKTLQPKELPAKGHTKIIDKAVAASCTSNGLTEGSHCSVCNTVITQQKTTVKLPHKPIVDNAVAASCTSNGLTKGSHCAVCNTVITQQKTTDKLPHKPIVDNAVVSSCTSNGLTEGSHCSVCNTVITQQKTTDKLPHKPIVDNAVAASCTSNGLTEGSHCSVCNTVIVKQTSVAKTAHIFVNGICHCGVLESLKYTLSSNSDYYILAGIGTYTGTTIVIPETYNGLPVKEIARSAFHSNATITSVTFNRSIEKIGNYAFFQCTNLAGALQFPDSLLEIGESAFNNCGKITDVSFGSSLHTIGYLAFKNCSLIKTLTIPASVKKIDKYAFNGCSSVTDVYFEKTTTWICYHSTYPASIMGERALSYSKAACSFLIDLYNDRLWKCD